MPRYMLSTHISCRNLQLEEACTIQHKLSVFTGTIHGMPSTETVSSSAESLTLWLALRMRHAVSDIVVSAVNEDLVKGMVDLLVSSGLKKAGYSYFVIDGNLWPHA